MKLTDMKGREIKLGDIVCIKPRQQMLNKAPNIIIYIEDLSCIDKKLSKLLKQGIVVGNKDVFGNE